MKKITTSLLGLLAAGLVCLPAPAQELFEQQEIPNPDNTPSPVFPVPTQRQVEWMKMEFYGFSHYGYNTFLGKEWGNDTKPDATIYAPETVPNCEQWVTTMKSAGMTGVVAVVKHHDGFCMWPTESTDFNVTASAGAGPQVDVPKLISEACKKHDMKFGVYLSPWDANASNYATQDYVDQNFRTQITELLTNYGDVFEVWFDGANGRILRRHQPDLEKHRQAHLLRLSQHHRLHPRAPTERPRLGTGVPLVRQRAGLLRKDLLVEHRHPLGAGRRQQQHRL